MDEVFNQLTPTIQLGVALVPNKTMLSVQPVDKNEAPNQPTPTTQLGALVSNKTILLVLPADEALNQLLLAMQLETLMLLQQNLAKVPGTLLALVPQERPRGKDKSCLRRSKGQKQEHVDRSYSVGGGELMDWTVATNSIANTLNQNRRKNE